MNMFICTMIFSKNYVVFLIDYRMIQIVTGPILFSEKSSLSPYVKPEKI